MKKLNTPQGNFLERNVLNKTTNSSQLPKNRKILLKSLLSKTAVISLPKQQRGQIQQREELHSSPITFDVSDCSQSCCICKTENKNQDEVITVLTPFEKQLLTREKILTEDENESETISACLFCAGQIKKLVELKKTIELVQEDFNNVITVIKTVMKMEGNYFQKDFEETEEQTCELFVINKFDDEEEELESTGSESDADNPNREIIFVEPKDEDEEMQVDEECWNTGNNENEICEEENIIFPEHENHEAVVEAENPIISQENEIEYPTIPEETVNTLILQETNNPRICNAPENSQANANLTILQGHGNPTSSKIKTKHRKTEMKTRAHPCVKCAKNFLSTSHLKRHLKTHRKEFHHKGTALKLQPSNKDDAETTKAAIVDVRPKRKSRIQAEQNLQQLITDDSENEDEENEEDYSSHFSSSSSLDEEEKRSSPKNFEKNHTKNRKTWQRFVEEECEEAKKTKLQRNQEFYSCPNCDNCTQQFPSIRSLCSHYRNFHFKGLIVCKSCKKDCPRGWNQFRMHVKAESHHILKNSANLTEDEIKAKLPFVCAFCPKQFSNEKNLKGHEQHHKTWASDLSETPAICETCGRGFASDLALSVHRRAFHKETTKIPAGTEERQFACPKCPKRFYDRKLLISHNSKFHPSSKTPKFVKCKHCGKNYAKLGIRNHIKLVHGNMVLKVGPKKRTCPIPGCSTKEMHPANLLPHLELQHFPVSFEAGVEGIQCPFECGSFSGTEEEWERHVNQCCVGKEIAEKPPKCHKCNTNFPSHFTRILHQLKAHPEACFTCDFCPLKFTTKAALQVLHMPIHPESRPHKCPKCGKSFRAAYNLAVHRGSVCNDDEEARKAFVAKRKEKNQKFREMGKPFKCLECGKGFVEEKRMKRHFEKSHGGTGNKE